MSTIWFKDYTIAYLEGLRNANMGEHIGIQFAELAGFSEGAHACRQAHNTAIRYPAWRCQLRAIRNLGQCVGLDDN